MGKRWFNGLVAVACLLGLAALWTAQADSSASKVERLPVITEDTPDDLSRVRLEFREDTEPPLEMPPAFHDHGSLPRMLSDRLKVPGELPGAHRGPIQLPARDPNNPKAFDEACQRVYPPLPPLGSMALPQSSAGTNALMLDDLERIAIAKTSNSHRAEVLAEVRHGYFAVLAAQDTIRVQEALTRFTDEAYRSQVELVKIGLAASYEPLQLRVLAYQQRGQLTQARNRYHSAWKQLAAAFGRPELPPQALDGRIDLPLPSLRHEVLLARLMSDHPELRQAERAETQARQLLLAAESTRKPTGFGIQNAFATFLNRQAVNDRPWTPGNSDPTIQAAALQARAELVRIQDESSRVRYRLIAQLAEAYERYDTQRRLVVFAREHILPDLIQVLQGVALRRQQDPFRVGFGAVVNAQNGLADAMAKLMQANQAGWDAFIDLGMVLQVADLSELVDDRKGVAVGGSSVTANGTPTYSSWPDVMPILEASLPIHPVSNPHPASRKERVTLPSPLPCPSKTCLPQEIVLPVVETPSRGEPHPVADSMFVTPLGPQEKSSKRGKFFTWPLRRGDAEVPKMLPQMEDPKTCCPPMPEMTAPAITPLPKSMPKEVPASSIVPPAPPKSMPGNISLPTVWPGPQITEGPREKPVPGPALSPMSEPNVVVPVAASSVALRENKTIVLPTTEPNPRYIAPAVGPTLRIRISDGK